MNNYQILTSIQNQIDATGNYTSVYVTADDTVYVSKDGVACGEIANISTLNGAINYSISGTIPPVSIPDSMQLTNRRNGDVFIMPIVVTFN